MDEWQARVNSDTGFYLANPYGRAWWENFSVGNSALAPDLVAAVNKRLDENVRNYTLTDSRRIIERIDTTPDKSP